MAPQNQLFFPKANIDLTKLSALGSSFSSAPWPHLGAPISRVIFPPSYLFIFGHLQ